MRRPILTLLLASFALAATAGASLASAINLDINQVRTVPLPGTPANVAVGNNKIAEVTMINAHSVIITGLDYGATGLLVTDKEGHVLLQDTISVSPPDEGRVTIYRGEETMQYSCGGHCQQLPKETTNASGEQTTTFTLSATKSGG